ncbi:heme exporter protein CcmB [Sporomusa aerivorans]|uniref:heme exporter protein CcmB n=1 Tax=Sporomusa aerivorans TaxID=204936 RepID=UPI00352B6AD0
MPKRQLPWHSSLWAVMQKDLRCELRSRYAVSSLAMFALVTVASISMSLAGLSPSSDLAAALLWVVLFFCAMAGLARVFISEQEAGTLFVLQFYGRGQAVLFGKLIFNTLLLMAVTVLVIPLFIVLMNLAIPQWIPLLAVLVLGNIGIAAVATLTALMVCQAGGKGSLFAVITFPLLLPQYLTVIAATGKILENACLSMQDFWFMAGYDITVLIASSILFDYLWCD